METAKKAIVQVGHGGRGFIVGARDRFVVTAAHCVPIEHIPTPDMSNGPEQLTFPNIIGPLGETPASMADLHNGFLRSLQTSSSLNRHRLPRIMTRPMV